MRADGAGRDAGSVGKVERSGLAVWGTRGRRCVRVVLTRTRRRLERAAQDALVRAEAAAAAQAAAEASASDARRAGGSACGGG